MDELEELRITIETLKSDITGIILQFKDPLRRAELGAAYPQWKRRANYAMAMKRRALGEAKTRRAILTDAMMKGNREARKSHEAERLARHTQVMEADYSKKQRKAEVIRNAGLEVEFITNLYIALTRLYKKTQLVPSEKDAAILDCTHQYLIDIEVFES